MLQPLQADIELAPVCVADIMGSVDELLERLGGCRFSTFWAFFLDIYRKNQKPLNDYGIHHPNKWLLGGLEHLDYFSIWIIFHIFQRGKVKSHQWENPPFLIGKPR